MANLKEILSDLKKRGLNAVNPVIEIIGKKFVFCSTGEDRGAILIGTIIGIDTSQARCILLVDTKFFAEMKVACISIYTSIEDDQYCLECYKGIPFFEGKRFMGTLKIY